MLWWPRQTPRIGVLFSGRSITAIDTPASFNVHGPGEDDDTLGASCSISSTVSASLRSRPHLGAQCLQVLDKVVGEKSRNINSWLDHQQRSITSVDQCVRDVERSCWSSMRPHATPPAQTAREPGTETTSDCCEAYPETDRRHRRHLPTYRTEPWLERYGHPSRCQQP